MSSLGEGERTCPHKKRILNRVRKQLRLDFLAIMEPMVPLDGRFMARRLGFLDVVSNCGNQIWFFWGPDVRCQVLLDHEQLLHIRLESNKWPKPLFVTAVYAKCDTVERRALWDALRAVSVGASPWFVGDDFNTVLSPDERSGALPRVVAHLELSQSNHRGLLVEAKCAMERKVSSFHFQHMWTTHSEFLGVVRRNWQYPTVDSGMMRLQQKLTRLKHCLKEWNKTVFGNVFDNVAAAERGLKETDEAYDQDPCDRTLVERNRCSAELVRVLAQEETFWGQKAGFGSLFFQRLLTAEPVFPEEMNSEHLEDGLTDEDRRFLCVMPTLGEVREAMFSIDPDSVAGPDGLGQSFFILVKRSLPRMFSAQ
ncbi:UNVERIFIED_CONTAM: hypothetical protein Scaly_2562200 [Sesamum calycinum]|uniref:Endonuclease/exonuclease/phosphatase domain-containing protein n=1 Tax=Sesamum calycinum TaxID=2727403 RepID=A0AAW2KDZ7_9LAMI